MSTDYNWIDAKESDREVVRLWRAWRTMHQMMKDRGYQVSEQEITISLDGFKDRYTDDGMANRDKMVAQFDPDEQMYIKHTPLPTRSEPKPTPTCGRACVRFAKESSPGIKGMRQFSHELQDKFTTGILVTQTSLTPAAKKIIPAVLPTIIELFLEQELVVNISQHELVPKHVLLSPEEKKKLLERYRLKETQLPRIQVADPMARYLGLRRGNVVKIIRKSETAGRYASYRWTF